MKGKRIILTHKDIMTITGTTRGNADKTMRHLRDVLNKPVPMRITIRDYSDYYGISIEEIYLCLGL